MTWVEFLGDWRSGARDLSHMCMLLVLFCLVHSGSDPLSASDMIIEHIVLVIAVVSWVASTFPRPDEPKQ